MSKYFIVVFAFVLVAGTIGATIYKWVDEKGVTHYSETVPPGQKNREVKIQPSSPPKTEGATPPTKTWQEKEQEFQKRHTERPLESYKSQNSPEPSTQLGPLPAAATSEYLTTESTGIAYDFASGHLVVQFTIKVQANPDIPAGAYLEFRFENPADPGNPIVVGKTVGVNPHNIKEDSFFVLSPEIERVKCGNYEVLVNVYESERKTKLLGRHLQLIQSRVDAARVSSPEQLIYDQARYGRICP